MKSNNKSPYDFKMEDYTLIATPNDNYIDLIASASFELSKKLATQTELDILSTLDITALNNLKQMIETELEKRNEKK